MSYPFPYSTYGAKLKKPTAEDRANQLRRAKLHRTAHDISVRLSALQPDDIAAVPALFVDCAKTADDRYEVFRLLDEKPGLFPNYLTGHWYSLLRKCRNQPEHGKRLFRVINGGAR